MSHSTDYRSFWRLFYGSDNPTNRVTALKDDVLSWISRCHIVLFLIVDRYR